MSEEKRCSVCDAELPRVWTPTACPTCGWPLRHRGFQAAWRKGYEADPGERCPYPDLRAGYHNGVTFSAAWRRYWEAGRDWAEKERLRTVERATIAEL